MCISETVDVNTCDVNTTTQLCQLSQANPTTKFLKFEGADGQTYVLAVAGKFSMLIEIVHNILCFHQF